MAQTVWLGLAGDLIDDSITLDLYTTRIGGAPVFPGQTVPATAVSALLCSVCGSRLSLVLQAYAPHPNAPDRIILVFGCTKLGCGKSADCWKALRCQLQPQQQQQQQQQQCLESSTGQGVNAALPGTADSSQQQPVQQPVSTQTMPKASAAAAADDAFAAAEDWGDAGDWSTPAAAVDPWAAAGSSHFGASADESVTTLSACNAFDFSDLTSSIAAAAADQQAAAAAAAVGKQKAKQPDAAPEAAEDVAVATAVCVRGTAGPELPEFYLYAEAEPDEAAVKAISNKELQHVQQLISEYEAQESASAASTNTSTKPTAAAAAASSSAAAAAAAGSTEDGASWAGETYEKDEIRGVERGYLKFSKRVARQPEQCARYCLQGQVLWPKAQVSEPAPCPRCKGPRVFELQLMPALIQMVIEAGQMLQEQGLPVNHQVIDAVANWDWCTLAVFTCQASCSRQSQTDSTSAKEEECDACFEEVANINEQDCHTAMPPPVAAGISSSTPAQGPDADGDDWIQNPDKSQIADIDV